VKLLAHTFKTVIPAQAGIQCGAPRINRTLSQTNRTPAFAGVTSEEIRPKGIFPSLSAIDSLLNYPPIQQGICRLRWLES
jgi:hypothetical protein